MKTALREALAEARRTGTPVAIVTDLADGSQTLVSETAATGDLELGPELLAAADAMLANGTSGALPAPGRDLFLRVYATPWRMIITGAVHIAQHLAPMAAACGFAVSVVDPRTAFATPERFDGVRLVHRWADEFIAEEPLDRRAAVVALTHDPKLDDPALEAALRSSAFYIGALGSRRTHARRVDRLATAGFTAAEIARIHAPIGLDLGGRSPAEIAVAILAQILQSRYGKS